MSVSPRLILSFAMLLVLSPSTSWARPDAPSAARPPASKPPTVSGTTAPRAKPVADPRAAKPDRLAAPEEVSPLPPTGPISLENLIELALFNNLDVLDAQRKMAVAKAKRAAATDLKNPELRLGYSNQTDVEVGRSYHDSSTSYADYAGSEFDSQYYSGTRDGTKAATPLAQQQISRNQTESSRFHETRYRTIERDVTPGATQDVVVTREYETRHTTTGSTRDRADTGGFPGTPTTQQDKENGSRKNDQVLVGETRTVVKHRDVTTPESSWGGALRFPFPNPWEISAKIKSANAEIRTAEYQELAVENELIAKVRALFEDLSYYDAKEKFLQSIAAKRQELMDNNRVQAMDKLAGSAADVSKTRLEGYDARMKADEMRRELARLTGLNAADRGRISIPANFRHRKIDLRKLDEPYLLQMASVYRMDLQVLHAKNEAAHAEYSRERANRLPYLGYLQGGYSYQNDRGGRDTADYSLSAGISIPLWSNLYNKAERVPEAEARALSRQIGHLQTNITSDVSFALEGLREAESMMAAAEKEFAALELMMDGEARGGAAFSKNPNQVWMEADEVKLNINLQRLDMHRRYNAAVQYLERALGTRLEKVLQPTGK